MKYPDYFVDEMVFGAFKSFKHQHIFEAKGGETIMTDVFDYVSPCGILGKLADWLFLKRYMTDLLGQRNHVIKEHAENQSDCPETMLTPH